MKYFLFILRVDEGTETHLVCHLYEIALIRLLIRVCVSLDLEEGPKAKPQDRPVRDSLLVTRVVFEDDAAGENEPDLVKHTHLVVPLKLGLLHARHRNSLQQK